MSITVWVSVDPGLPDNVYTKPDGYTALSGETLWDHDPSNAELNSFYTDRIAAIATAIDGALNIFGFDEFTYNNNGWLFLGIVGSPQHLIDWQQANYPNIISTVNNLAALSNGAIPSISSPRVPFSGDYNDLTNKPTLPSTVRTTSTLSLSLVGTGATGTQISTAKDSTVRVNVSTSTTSTIGGASTSLVALKICSTNNATEASWTTVATLENDQTIILALALQSLQVVKGQLCADVPAGWYAKLVNSGTGTHTESYVTGQKTIYG